MRIPVVRGTISRRMLVNFRIEPEVAETLVPKPFKLKLVNGKAIAGICQIRLENIRPSLIPWRVGISSENLAHRFAVEWEENGQLRSGVYIHRRDSSSPFNVVAGGRAFPGVHYAAKFQIVEQDNYFRTVVDSEDGYNRVVIEAKTASELPKNSVFKSLQEASDFFASGSQGYSPAYHSGQFEGMELQAYNWKVEPLEVSIAESRYFTNLPKGSVEFDCALLMRNIEHEWHQLPPIYALANCA